MRSMGWVWVQMYRPRDLDRMVNAELRVAPAPPGEHDVHMAQRVQRRKRAYKKERARHEQGTGTRGRAQATPD